MEYSLQHLRLIIVVTRLMIACYLPGNVGDVVVTASGQTVCMTSDCVMTASRILEALDDNVDPCDDFFEFACGAWNRKNIIPDDRASYNTFGKLKDELDVILKRLLEKPVESDEANAITQAKYLYSSCLNMTAIEARGDDPLRDIIHSLGGWPILDDYWDEKNFDIIDLIARLRLFNNRVLINSWVSADDKNSEVNIIQLDQAQLGLPSRDYYLEGRDAKPLTAYQNFAADVAKLLGVPHERADREIKKMVDFEVQLANITVPEEDRRNSESIYHRYTVRELYDNITDYIDWVRLLNGIFQNVSIQINMTEELVVYAPSYMKELAGLLKVTPKRTVGNYMLWRIVMNRVSNMPQKYLDVRREFSKALYGTSSDRARWRICVNYVNDNFGMAVGRMFVQERFDETAKKNALDMIHDIREAFSQLLEEVSWMDDKTREVARQKAEFITEKIGYPDYIMNNTALDMDYEGEEIPSFTTFLVCALLFAHKQIDVRIWTSHVNKLDKDVTNGGIFQPPFYHKSYPKSLNYGGIAMVIGHEITHGFDDRGRMFDKDGNLVQWWSEDVIHKFKQQAQCIVDQYSNYTVEEVGMNLNGRQTQGENIADNGGLKQSFRAYRNWVLRKGDEEPLLPGLKFSHNQLFFLNFAQIWCGGARPESYIGTIRSGKHSPGRFRVIGTLSNSYNFAEAFDCPAGSKMNPINKCSVW
ncbi:hypothetical protein LSH36_487g03042 [Paralvinella palmiformis]|uniref:Neprilysin n=1 Tax=Paralvinella palmiformis TaxID=53620 RepID=A0AAD9MYB1_9ANNE|nr:hypothetical protein LSH36_487g03042 [Paralvinella palmiformis]